MDATDGFEGFVAVVEHGSISAAARAAGVPRETLSRQLARLEERLGARLVHRGRRLTLTPAGELLHDRARPLVLAAREATAAVRDLDETPSGLLRVSVPPGAGGAFFGRICAAFVDRYPRMQLEVFATSRYVDLVSEGFDVALRAGAGTDPGLVTRTVWSSAVVAVASREYLDAHGRPASPEDLRGHECLRNMRGTQPNSAWPLQDGRTVSVSGRMTSNELGVLVAAVEAHRGIAMLPRPLARAGLDAGRLEVVLPGVLGARSAMRLVFLERRLMPAKVRAFIDHTVEAFRSYGVEAVEASLASLRA